MQALALNQKLMKITLLRHGKPIIPSLKKLSASAFYKWVQEYNTSGLCPSTKPTTQAFRCAKECNAITGKNPGVIRSCGAGCVREKNNKCLSKS